MLRTGDAVGAGGLILLDESTDPYGVEAVRASMGAIFTQKLVSARWDDFLAWLRAGPGQLVATWLSEDMQDYQAVRCEAPTFILIGNESQGLPEARSEEHTSELQSLMRISYAVFCLKKKNKYTKNNTTNHHNTQ